jgi:hypothetical protein
MVFTRPILHKSKKRTQKTVYTSDYLACTLRVADSGMVVYVYHRNPERLAFIHKTQRQPPFKRLLLPFLPTKFLLNNQQQTAHRSVFLT